MDGLLPQSNIYGQGQMPAHPLCVGGNAQASVRQPAPEIISPQPPIQARQPEPIVIRHEDIQSTLEYDRQLKQIIITMRREDGELVQQIPNEKVVQTLKHVMETLNAMLDIKG